MKAIYARQSLDKKESLSIEGQIDECKTFLSVNEDYKVYQEQTWRKRARGDDEAYESQGYAAIICGNFFKITKNQLETRRAISSFFIFELEYFGKANNRK